MIQSRCVRWLPQLAWDSLAVIGVRPELTTSGKKRVGILRLGGLGDFVLFLPALKAMLQEYPEENYDRYLITDRNGASLVPMVGDIKNIIVFEMDGSRFIHNQIYRAQVLRTIRRLNLEILIDAALLRRIEGNDAIVRASGAKAIGFREQKDQCCEGRYGNYAYQRLVDDPRWSTHEALRYQHLIGQPELLSSNILPTIELPYRPETRDKFLIFPGAKFPERRWPPYRFAEVARFIYQRTGWIPIAVGVPTDTANIEAVIDASPDLPWERAKAQTIAGLCELIASAQIVITNDSGPMHLAPALQVPTVAVVPGAEFTAYPNYPADHPYLHIVHQEYTACFDCKWSCNKQASEKTPVPCLASVSAAMVCVLCERVISGIFS